MNPARLTMYSIGMKKNTNELKRLYKVRKRGELKAEILRYLATHPCIDCSESDPIVLDFDHQDQATKSFAIAKAVNDVKNISVIMDEIAKCQVRCANCHRRRTAKQLGYWKTFI